ncbi:MAG: histidine kinase [Deltaproteobacteria bacterium]|nr:histidine kinase [Deltaproteobacteria bacterium]
MRTSRVESTEWELASALPAGRTMFTGVLAAVGLVAIPLAARTAFGLIPPLQFAACVVLSLPVVTFVVGTMTATLRYALRRMARVRPALALACMVGALETAAICLMFLPLVRRYPAVFQTLPGEPTTALYFLVTGITDSLILTMIWAAVVLYPAALRVVRQREVSLAHARAEAEILRLRAHLEPHFVLNTLNAIAGLVVDEPRQARNMLGALGDLFRDATSDRESEHHTLAQELDWLERYFAIARGRYGNSLQFDLQISRETRDLLLPRLLLQPIVENAIQHGALRREGLGTITLRAFVQSSGLVCEILDEGPGPSAEPRRDGARGLSIVERRLALEAPGSEFSLHRRSEGGARALLRIVQPARAQ